MSETETSPAKNSVRGRVLHYAHQTWVRCALLVIFGIVVHSPALPGQLVWDDASLVRDNPFIKSPVLILEAFRHSLDASSPHYRPVQTISYAVDYLFWNANPYGYHLSNLLWHVGSGLLLYFLLLRLLAPFSERFVGKNRGAGYRLMSGAAFVIALLWIVHPVHSAAVDYISGRADSLAFFFACGGWLLFLHARESQCLFQRSALYAFAAFSALLALCSRESACMWMLLFLFYLFAFDKFSSRRAKWIVTGVCLSIVAIYAGLRQLPAQDNGGAAAIAAPIPQRAVLMVRALGDYSRLMVFPTNLHVERTVRVPENAADHNGWRDSIGRQFLSLLGLLTAAALVYGAMRQGKAQPIRLLGAAWFILAYLPISNLFQLNATVAEHWLYLPSVGFLLFVTGCFLELPPRLRGLLPAAACIALFGLSARSIVRSGDWVSPETFYRHSLDSGAAKSRMALNLGQIYAARKDYARAEPILRKVVSLNPGYPMAQNALGHLLIAQGKREEAAQVFAVATRLAAQAPRGESRTWIAALNVAYMHYTEQDFSAALAVLQKARADYPGVWPLIKLEAEALQAAHRNDDALVLVQEFSSAHWWHAPSALALGQIYLDAGRFAEAEAVFRQANRLDVHGAEAFNWIALTYLRENRLADAYAMQRRALARQPDEPHQYLLLGDILKRMGRNQEAGTLIAEASRLQATARADGTLD